MTVFPEGNAIVYCEGEFTTTNGKTAHGLVRRTRRYYVLCVVDSTNAGKDAGTVLDGKKRGIPIIGSVAEAVELGERSKRPPTHLVIGLTPDGGRLKPESRKDVLEAVSMGLNIDSGLHDFLSEDPEISAAASERGVVIRDIRKALHNSRLHFFTGKIREVGSFRIAVLGTDSAVGKRTTSWLLLESLERRGCKVEMIGTGQTSWLQGARYSIIFDSLVNDFVTGEIEHAVWSAWKDLKPDIIILEGQGSLMNPAYPGGFELLAAGKPDIVILQHAPARRDYDSFPGYPIEDIDTQIKAVEIISRKNVVAITVNHEGLAPGQIPDACRELTEKTGLPAFDVIVEGADGLADIVMSYLRK